MTGTSMADASRSWRLLLGLALASACGPGRKTEDAAFAALQDRGQAVMGVDQYASAHVFEDLPDGGRIILDQKDSADAAAIATIRRHMQDIAVAFRAGDFSKPFQVHAHEVPGTPGMTTHRVHLTYQVIDRPRGAEVRIRTADPAAVQAVHQFLEFQRSDHRAPAHEGGP